MSAYTIILYYKYTHVADPEGFMNWHRSLCEKLGLKGRVLIAHEGINGTLEGTPENIKTYCEALHAQNGSEGTFGNFSDVVFKTSPGTGDSFPKLKIKVRQEIVTARLGEDDVDPNKLTGVHLAPELLKQWYENGEDFQIIDMRNSYEFEVGHFKGSIDPGLRNFRDLPNILPKIEQFKEKKVVTVCTGGVRCEKASGYLMKKGFKDVYQLDGGMAKYMEKFPGQDFDGALYVFDNRITMDTTKERAIVGKCHHCGVACERFVNCPYDVCHYQFLCCEKCEKETPDLQKLCPMKCNTLWNRIKALLSHRFKIV
ncbi:MAG: hypothetical protein RL094_122 [Candidatus Parcubacteria bacterium]|jgi:UPF0176 protein